MNALPLGRYRQRGLTIVEFMIAIALGFIIIAAMLTIFANSSRSRQEMQKSTQQKESGRFAVQLLADNLAMAGYLGEFNPTPMATPTVLPDPCTTDLAALVDALPLHVQGVNDAVAASAVGGCIADLKANTDVLVVRRAGDCVVNGFTGLTGTPGCETYDANRFYFQSSLCNDATELAYPANSNAEYAAHHFALAQASSDLTRRRTDCGATPADVRRYHTHIYFVANNNEPGDGVPTLKRWELGLGIVPLVDGIEDMQIEYGIDNDNDGMPDAWASAPASVDDWRNAMTVRVHLLARNTQTSPGHSDDRTYILSDKTVGPFGDAYKRHVYVTTARLTNPTWRRQ